MGGCGIIEIKSDYEIGWWGGDYMIVMENNRG